MADKPKVYIETTIVSYLTARLPADPLIAGQMLATRKWWNESRSRFELLTSQIVRDEASRGDAEAAAERLKVIESLVLAPIPAGVQSLTELLLSRHALPS